MAEEQEERLRMVRSIADFCDDEQQLRAILQSSKNPITFDAFDPIGRIPIAQGLIKTLIVNKLVDAGCSVKIWMSDWTAEQKYCLKNDKIKLRVAGEHMIEVWKAIGMKVDQVEFLWSSEIVLGPRSVEYWPYVLDIARHCDLPCMFSCLGIPMKEDDITNSDEKLPSSELLFPCMQCANLFYTKAQICLLGMDKQGVTNLIKDYTELFDKDRKPVFLSNSILPSLDGQREMSRSNPDFCIFMEDEENEVKTKINKRAFCPPNIVENNPCIDLVKSIIFPWCREFEVNRVPEYGGNKTFTTMEELCSDYSKGALHPGDLKAGLIKSLNKILQPVRDHLRTNAKAKEFFMKVKKLKLT